MTSDYKDERYQASLKPRHKRMRIKDFQVGWDAAIRESSIVLGLVEAAKFEVRKHGDASPQLYTALVAYETAIAQIKGDK